MKTPIQEAEEYILGILKESEVDMGTYGLIELKFREMLEKEKEVIMDAYEAGSHTEWNEDTWMLLEKQEYYNETFNNKER